MQTQWALTDSAEPKSTAVGSVDSDELPQMWEQRSPLLFTFSLRNSLSACGWRASLSYTQQRRKLKTDGREKYQSQAIWVEWTCLNQVQPNGLWCSNVWKRLHYGLSVSGIFSWLNQEKEMYSIQMLMRTILQKYSCWVLVSDNVKNNSLSKLGSYLFVIYF